jgi:hypothetical protein
LLRMDDHTHPPLSFFAKVRWTALAAILCAPTWLGGCALIDEALNPPEPEPAVVAEPEPPQVAEPALPPAPRPRPPARVARLPTPADRPPPPPQTAPPAQTQPEPEPAPEPAWMPEIKLVGMSRGETATLLGAPSEERDAAPAKIWKFAAGECAVDVYFYLDVARNDFYALHYNVQDRNGATTGEAADRCLQRIYSENRK